MLEYAGHENSAYNSLRGVPRHAHYFGIDPTLVVLKTLVHEEGYSGLAGRVQEVTSQLKGVKATMDEDYQSRVGASKRKVA